MESTQAYNEYLYVAVGKEVLKFHFLHLVPSFDKDEEVRVRLRSKQDAVVWGEHDSDEERVERGGAGLCGGLPTEVHRDTGVRAEGYAPPDHLPEQDPVLVLY